MLSALVLMLTLQAAEPPATDVELRQPTPPIDLKALARRWDRELTGRELRTAIDLRRHPRRGKRPGTRVSAESVKYADEREPRAYRASERVSILAVKHDRDGILLRIGPPGYDPERLLPGGNTASSIRLPPPLNEEAADNYNLFEKSARYADDEAAKQRRAGQRTMTLLLTGTTERDYREALNDAFVMREGRRRLHP